ncbi:unnamed protein product [Echinostoma caproni]|uniref:Notum n=1 Tax=Echinostoma caproni TaxID=27848 RepID=A0A183AAH6_9TREM|nr:unnamed protein product [Echinostoma caproni]
MIYYCTIPVLYQQQQSGMHVSEEEHRIPASDTINLTSLSRISMRQHLMAFALILITWTTVVRGRPSGQKSVFRSTMPMDRSDISSDSLELTDWQPLTRPSYSSSQSGTTSTASASSTSSPGFNRWNWSWKVSQKWTDNFQMHQFHKLYFLNDSTALCNDGSPAGYYYRPSKKRDAKNWLIFLEGGWYCFDEETCRLRESSTLSLFSSTSWPTNRAFDGILSAYENVNPIYHDYHNVTSTLTVPEFYFHGSKILQSVVDQLPWPKTGQVERVVFAGSSAGGIGVLMNVDRLSRRLVKRLGYPVLVSGIVDSAWFIHTPAYRPAKCSNVFECPAEEGIHRGMRFWKARIPKRCRKQQPKGERWRCYLAPFMYEYLKTPVYIVQSLFDEAQMQMSKVPLLTGGTYEKWAYIQKLGKEVARSLQNINNWVHKAIGTVGLVDALQAWDRQLVREWTRKRMILWSMQHPYSLLHLQNQYMTQPAADLDQSMNARFTKNSTLLFLSRLVSMLNQRGQRRHRRHLTTRISEITQSESDKLVNSPEQLVRQRATRNTVDTYYTSSPTSLTMTKQPRLTQANPSYHSYAWYLNRMPATRLPSYFTANDYNLYHVIDSCGLVSGHGDRGGYLCKPDQFNETSRVRPLLSNGQSLEPPEFDHLIPQCNPTCGFLSNPHRMKLVDVLALYEVNTDLLASILGLTASELKNLDSEQQMRMLFCGNSRRTRRARDSFSFMPPRAAGPPHRFR